MRSLSVLILGLCLPFCAAWADEGHHHALTEEEVGSVQFETSCSKDIAGSFNRAVALLHSFQYEQTRHAFTQIAKESPELARAGWVIEMTHYHGLGASGNIVAGGEAFRKAQHIAATNTRTTA